MRFKHAGGRGKLLAVMLVVAMAGLAFMPLASSGSASGTHIGYRDEFTSASPTLPPNYVVVAGPSDAHKDWQVASGSLQAINVAGTSVQLADPNLPIDLVGNRIISLCIQPEKTVNSIFYGGFLVNVANLIDINIGHGTDLTIRINVPSAVVQLLDQVGHVLDQVPLPVPVSFNAFTCLSIHVDAVNGLLDLLFGQIDQVTGTVRDGVGTVLHVNPSLIPSGTVGFTQPSGNTARVMFAHLVLQATPDVPLGTTWYAGPTNGQVQLSWKEPATDGGAYVTEYAIYRGTSPDNMVRIDTAPAFETSYTDTPYTGLVPTTQKFYYAISAINDVGEGPMTNAVCTIPYPVGLLPLDGTGLGCGDHGLVSNPTLSKLLG